MPFVFLASFTVKRSFSYSVNANMLAVFSLKPLPLTNVVLWIEHIFRRLNYCLCWHSPITHHLLRNGYARNQASAAFKERSALHFFIPMIWHPITRRLRLSWSKVTRSFM